MAEEQNKRKTEELAETLVRIAGQDISGDKNVYVGLTKIKGISWSLSNAVCKKTGIDKRIKINELSNAQIDKIENFLSDLKLLYFLKNRGKDLETGESQHLLSTDLAIRKEFDIKRMKKIKSYKGVRHSFKLPVRGQRTRSHFRKSGISVGVKRVKKGKKG